MDSQEEVEWCDKEKSNGNDDDCNWHVRAEGLTGSSYFITKKYAPHHLCAPSKRKGSVRTASAKTIGTLITHMCETAKEGPRSNDIVQYMRSEHGVEISYSLAWDAREYAINKGHTRLMKGILKGDSDSSSSLLASLRGFYAAIRKVIVVDGTFLKSKYKGVLLVATALDGNSNLYPIAFGVVDSENDLAWNWFMRQLNVVIADGHSLAFVSDRNSSIVKAIANVYPQAHHGICIHHLLNNVVTYCSGKGVAGLVAKASKAYRAADFRKLFTAIYSISPEIGNYLIEDDVRKWARCQFSDYRYDINTTNPAELINSALRMPRKFPEGVCVTKQDKTIDPEHFYESPKGTRDSVFLVEAYNENGDLLEKDET
ncbi:uncharacterized protein LOC117126142 [Brassica rapa]|uniref:uncharacterized protein LOC117126142 n=1 Tax=Brassica campestris TaxID=3711 RepID=UPI00142D67A9|nr:uncharacterized protein LOC117126142 [Brassica rapa]